MMADEYFDSDQNNSQRQQNKLQAMFPPSNNLTSKPAAAASSDASQIKQQLATAEQGGGPNPPSSGYYQNVKTKTKLILPTAIWVLIIVGGLCFLSLLSSLNKTLGTLDTLIEIEQNNQQQNSHGHRKGNNNNDEKISSNDDDKQEISNELNRKVAFNDHQLSPIADRLQTSDSDDFIHTWFSFPSWASLESPFLRNNHHNHQIFNSEISSNDQNNNNKEQPFIHANIDKLNININTPNNQDDQDVKKIIPFSPLSEQLILPPQSLSDRLDFNSPQMSLEGINVRPSMFMRPQQPSHLSPDSRDHLIITLEGNSDGDQQRAPLPSPPLNAPLRHHHLGPQPNSPYELLVANGPQRPTFEDNLAESVAQSLFKVLEATNPDFPPKPDFPSREQSDGSMQPPFPPSPSPLPSPPAQPASPSSHPHPHSLPHSLSHSLFGPKPSHPLSAPHPDLEQPAPEQVAPIEFPPMGMPSKPLSLPLGDSIVFINGEPLIGDKKQSLSMDEDTQVPSIKEKDRNQVNDLFNLFFGPPPDSKLVVAQPHIVEPIEGTVKKEQQSLNVKDEPSSSPLDQPIKVTLTKFDKTEDGNEKEESPIELASLFSHMFSLPQFSVPPNAQNINQPGRAPPAANASRETMQCECHRIPGGNASSPRPPASGGGGGGSTNSTSSAGSSSGPPRPGGSSSGGSPGGPSGSSGGSSSPGGSGPPSGSSSNSSPQRSNSSTPSGGSGSSSGGSSGSGSSGGPPGGGQRQGQPAGQSSGNSPVNPVGYVAPPPYGPPPVGYALVDGPPRNQLPFNTAGQQSGNSSPRQVNPGFARPGSMLSALNNSTEFDILGQLDSADFQFDEDDEHDDSNDE